MKDILLATDGSACAARATEVAAELAKAFGSSLTVLNVCAEEASEDEAMRSMARVEGSLGDVLEAIAKQILNRAKDRADALGVQHVKVANGWGNPAEVILEFARQHQPDAIVVGRRGRGRLTGLLLGSVSQKLVTLAPSVVVVVP